jgi:hypothetical protein
MAYVTLNQKEIATLKGVARRGDENQGYQELLTLLDRLLNETTGEIHVSTSTLAMIQRYGSGKESKPNWRGTIFTIFGRTMGESLGGELDKNGHLIRVAEGAKPSRGNSKVYRRVV